MVFFVRCNIFIALHQKLVYKRCNLRSRRIGKQVRCGLRKMGRNCRGAGSWKDHALRQPKDDSHV
jgi:hypothetical protein